MPFFNSVVIHCHVKKKPELFGQEGVSPGFYPLTQ